MSHFPFDVVVVQLSTELPEAMVSLAELRAMTEGALLAVTPSPLPKDRAALLDHGADACISSPAAPEEIASSMRALTRLRARRAGEILQYADLVVDRGTRKAIRAGQAVTLSPREFQLLEYLMIARGEIVSAEQIRTQAFGIPNDTGTNIVAVTLARLRSKVDAGYSKKLLHNEQCRGYWLGEPRKKEPAESGRSADGLVPNSVC